ncbi:MAG: DNA recombination protein RmuC [Treponema sp.]|uniref:DNA recombination protein RmuC n=1 Tax=Treponema sp. TaxID=166 RepID=UPI00298DCE89|nr:DNA recombination protein RmuC [Treponema sp.]MCR5386569.1 DNA recombination protein RmuC [Treponema sp.]
MDTRILIIMVAFIGLFVVVMGIILFNSKGNEKASSESRKENLDVLMKFQDSINAKFDALTKNTHESMTNTLTQFMNSLSQRLDVLTKSTQETLINQQRLVQENLKHMQESNEKKLDQMRETVDEKLQSTLEKRLTGSFEIVTKQLEAVQKGLGEMQTLANDVGGLKRALTNVKSAGGMGEVQLESLLSQILSPEQYEKNAHPNPKDSKKVVEFAVKIPSKTTEGQFILLPVDSKYPAAVWDKLTKAYEDADKAEIELQKKALVTDIKKMAKDIKEKYIEVPYTTDFGLMFLPFEGLFAEVMRIPGLFQQIQDEFKVTISGPTTLNAFLNSLQMGFRTLAIQKETSKVWELLGSVKSEFGKFGDVLAATKKKLESATNEIESAERRSRQIEKKLTKVEVLPDKSSDAQQSLLDDLTDDE